MQALNADDETYYEIAHANIAKDAEANDKVELDVDALMDATYCPARTDKYNL